MESNEFIKKISVAFLERKPQFIETDNPYTAAKFYKDLADSDFSLYTKKDYQRVSRLLASVALHNGRITETSQDGQVITFTFSFSSQGNYEELKEYLSQYESSISLQTKIYCRQPAVNAILSHYDLLCAQDKIKTKFAVDFPTLSPISSVDFCIVLGNLLENAYLECKTLQKYEKFIHLKARQTSPGAFVLLIENPYEHEIKKTDSGFFLSSRRKNCVGTGLKSVTAICKKYDGHLSIETDNHRFKVKMFLQC